MRLRVNKTAAAATTGVDCEVGTLFFVETVAEWTKVRFVMYRAEVVKEGAQLGFREGISCSDVPAGCVRRASKSEAAVHVATSRLLRPGGGMASDEL